MKKEERLDYLLVLLLSTFSWFTIGGILSIVFDCFFSSPLSLYVNAFIPHIVLFITLIILSKALLKRPLLSLIKEGRLDLKKDCLILFVSLLILSLLSLFEKDKITPYIGTNKIAFLFLSIILFIPQTLSEEIAFRTLIIKAISPKRKITKFLTALLGGLVFTLPHILNKEVIENSTPIFPLLTYFLWGFLSFLLYFYSNNLESCLVLHYANNLFCSSIVGNTSSTIFSSPFFVSASSYSSFLLLISPLLLFSVTFFLEFLFNRRRQTF